MTVCLFAEFSCDDDRASAATLPDDGGTLDHAHNLSIRYDAVDLVPLEPGDSIIELSAKSLDRAEPLIRLVMERSSWTGA